MSWFSDNGFDRRGDPSAYGDPWVEGGGNRGSGEPEVNAMGTGGVVVPQVQDNWGRSPSHPDYGRPPGGAAPDQRTTAPTGGTEPYSDDRFLQIIHSYPATYEGAQQAADEMARVFGPGVVQLVDHPTKHDKFILPGGRVADQMYAAGSNAARWNDSITLEQGGGGGSLGALGGAVGGNWQAGIDPSYGFIKDEAQKGLESGAAARGTLLSGGFQKDMAKYIAGLASTEFGNVFGRNLSLAQLGLGAAGQAAGLGSSYSGQAGNLTGNQAGLGAEATIGAGNAGAAGTAAGAGLWGNTIGEIGGLIAPSLAGWLRRPAKADDPYGGGRVDPGGG